jgi:hypothetical protein
MKNAVKDENLKEGLKKIAPAKAEELKMDYPLSEKDEVKQAEANMRKRRKKTL